MAQTSNSFSLWDSRRKSSLSRSPVFSRRSMCHSRRRTANSSFFPTADASALSASMTVAIRQFPTLLSRRLRCHRTCPFQLLISTSLIFFLSLLSGVHYTTASSTDNVKQPVTYGSSIILVHAATGYRIFSGKISWGSGSGQQAVTAMPADERTSVASVFWNVEPPQNNNRPRPVLSPALQAQSTGGARGGRQGKAAAAEPVPALPTEGAAGKAVPCGATVVFEHAMSSVTMQALGIASPISNNREVSAASGSQASLAGFKVVCSDRSAKRWMTGDRVTLQHFALGANLQAEKQHKFTPYNCGRGCPIEGHIEVSISNTPRSSSSWGWGTPNDVWVAEPGIMIGPDRFAFVGTDGDEDESAGTRDEL